MAPGRRRGASKAKQRGELSVGDLVLAKVKGFPAWPAKISKPEDWNRVADPKKYFVQFFGTEEIAFVAPVDVHAFTHESKSKLSARCQGKTVKDFVRAFEEICEAFEELQRSKLDSPDKTVVTPQLSVSPTKECEDQGSMEHDNLALAGDSHEHSHIKGPIIVKKEGMDSAESADDHLGGGTHGLERCSSSQTLSASDRDEVLLHEKQEHADSSLSVKKRMQTSDGSSRAATKRKASKRSSRFCFLKVESSSGPCESPKAEDLIVDEVGPKVDVDEASLVNFVAEKADGISLSAPPQIDGNEGNDSPPLAVAIRSKQLARRRAAANGIEGKILKANIGAKVPRLLEGASHNQNPHRKRKETKFVELEHDNMDNKLEKNSRKMHESECIQVLPVNNLDLIDFKSHTKGKILENGNPDTTILDVVNAELENSCKTAQSRKKESTGEGDMKRHTKRIRVSEDHDDVDTTSGLLMKKDEAIVSKKCEFSKNFASESEQQVGCHPLKAHTRRRGQSPGDEDVLPLSKRRRRAMEAMSANAAEASDDLCADRSMFMKPSLSLSAGPSGDCIKNGQDPSHLDDQRCGNRGKEATCEPLPASHVVKAGSLEIACSSGLSQVLPKPQSVSSKSVNLLEEKDNNKLHRSSQSPSEPLKAQILSSPKGSEYKSKVVPAILPDTPESQKLLPKNSKSSSPFLTPKLIGKSQDNKVMKTHAKASGDLVVKGNQVISYRSSYQDSEIFNRGHATPQRHKLEHSSDKSKTYQKLNIRPYGLTDSKSKAVVSAGTVIDNTLLDKERSALFKEIKTVDSPSEMKHLIAAAQAKWRQARPHSLNDDTEASFAALASSTPPVSGRGSSPLSSDPLFNLNGVAQESSRILQSRPTSAGHDHQLAQEQHVGLKDYEEGRVGSGQGTLGSSLSGGTEAAVAREAFEGMVETLSRTKESIARATRLAIDCAKYGIAKEVVDILIRKLESEGSFHRRVDLFFLVDSITQCSHSQKGIAGASYVPAVQAALPRLLGAAAPPGSAARENRRQCLKVLRLWLERKILPESLIRHCMDDLGSSNDELTASMFLRRPTRAERAIDDPLREMEDMLVDEYGSNTSFQLPGFLSSNVFEDEDGLTIKLSAEKSPSEATDAAELQQHDSTPNDRRHHILEEVDGELEMEDVSANLKDDLVLDGNAYHQRPLKSFGSEYPMNSLTANYSEAPEATCSPPLPVGSPPSLPPLPSSPPPPPPPPPPPESPPAPPHLPLTVLPPLPSLPMPPLPPPPPPPPHSSSSSSSGQYMYQQLAPQDQSRVSDYASTSLQSNSINPIQNNVSIMVSASERGPANTSSGTTSVSLVQNNSSLGNPQTFEYGNGGVLPAALPGQQLQPGTGSALYPQHLNAVVPAQQPNGAQRMDSFSYARSAAPPYQQHYHQQSLPPSNVQGSPSEEQWVSHPSEVGTSNYSATWAQGSVGVLPCEEPQKLRHNEMGGNSQGVWGSRGANGISQEDQWRGRSNDNDGSRSCQGVWTPAQVRGPPNEEHWRSYHNDVGGPKQQGAWPPEGARGPPSEECWGPHYKDVVSNSHHGNWGHGSIRGPREEPWRSNLSDACTNNQRGWAYGGMGAPSCSGQSVTNDGFSQPPAERSDVRPMSFQYHAQNSFGSGGPAPGHAHAASQMVPYTSDIPAQNWRPIRKTS